MTKEDVLRLYLDNEKDWAVDQSSLAVQGVKRESVLHGGEQ
jgi:hypothetical protein